MDHIDQTIKELAQKVMEKEQELIQDKKTVNSLCKMVGKQPQYNIEDFPDITAASELRGDEYYGRPLATVITTILEGRKIQGLGPTTIKEMYNQMLKGGYQFDAKSDTNAMRGMRISMAKNKKFHKLPNGKWGLIKWYPTAKEIKESNKELVTQAETEIEEESASTENEDAGTEDSSQETE